MASEDKIYIALSERHRSQGIVENIRHKVIVCVAAGMVV